MREMGKYGGNCMRKRAALLIVTIVFLVMIILHYGADVVQAEETYKKTQENTSIGTSGIENPHYENYNNGSEVIPTGKFDYVYYGKYNGKPVKYRVLDTASDEFGVEGGSMFLDCDVSLFDAQFDEDGIPNQGAASTNEWEYSDLRKSLNGNGFLNKDGVFTNSERTAIAISKKSARSEKDGVAFIAGSMFCPYVPLTGDRIFVLDAAEATSHYYGYDDKNSSQSIREAPARAKERLGGYTDEDAPDYWLRTYGEDDSEGETVRAVRSYHDENLAIGMLDLVSLKNHLESGVSPAFNLKRSSILFSTRINGANKLTITDSSLTVSVNGPVEKSGNEITIPYSISGAPNRLAVFVTDKAYSDDSSALKYYKALESGQIPASGTVKFTLPDNLGTRYKLYLVAEIVHDSFETDYASIPAKIADTSCTITFDPDGGSLNSEYSTQNPHIDGTLDFLPVPTKDDQIFLGWFTQKTGGDRVTKETVFASPTTIYAHWSELYYVDENGEMQALDKSTTKTIDNDSFVYKNGFNDLILYEKPGWYIVSGNVKGDDIEFWGSESGNDVYNVVLTDDSSLNLRQVYVYRCTVNFYAQSEGNGLLQAECIYASYTNYFWRIGIFGGTYVISNRYHNDGVGIGSMGSCSGEIGIFGGKITVRKTHIGAGYKSDPVNLTIGDLGEDGYLDVESFNVNAVITEPLHYTDRNGNDMGAVSAGNLCSKNKDYIIKKGKSSVGISIKDGDRSVTCGDDSFFLTGEVEVPGTGGRFTWESSDPAVAAINPETGEVTTGHAGKTQIKASYVSDTVDGFAIITLTVKEKRALDDIAKSAERFDTEIKISLKATDLPADVGAIDYVKIDGEIIKTGSVDVSSVEVDQDGNVCAEFHDAGKGDTFTIPIMIVGQDYDFVSNIVVTLVATTAYVTDPPATISGLVYNGQPQALTDAGEVIGGTLYYAIGAAASAPADKLYTTSIPTATNAGTYYVWYKVVGDENHNDTDAANVPVVIAKADPDYTVPTGLTAVYGDKLQDVTLPAGWTWADADQIVGDAGTNTFKANYVPNDVTDYNSVENVDVTVSVSKGNGAVAVAPEVNAWTSDYVFAEAVNGQEYVIVKKGETPDWSKAVTPDDGSVTFTGLTPATEYSIYTRVKETDNTLASEPEKVDVMTSLIGWETRGEAKTGETITIIPDPENAEGLTWQWYYAEENEEGTVVRGEAIKGETSSSYVVKDSDVGKYLYFVISKGGEELETGYTGPIKIAINVTVSLEDWTYGEAPNTPIVTGNTGNGKVSFTYAKKGSEEPESETVPTLPGTYTVFAYVEESGDYAFGYAEADFTITKGTPAVNAPKARNLVYTGASQELVEAGVAVGGEMQYALGTETVATQPYATSIPTATDAGTYYVWYKAVGDENHSDSVPACVPVVIGSKESVEGEVTFNKGEGSDETPETVVESVESSDLAEFAETQKEDGKVVKVELEVTPKKEADIVPTSVDGTKQIAEGLFVGFDTEKVVTEYFDIDLTKYVDNKDAGNIHDTGSPIEIALKYDKTKMFDPVVVRTHNGKTLEFSKLNARPAKADYKDATYYVGDGVIYIYSRYFSDYAIIYTTVKTYNVDIITNTGSNLSKTVAEDSKVDLPTGLSKSGYTFGGWFSDEACTKEWKEDDAVTADITIYAKWIQNIVPYVPYTPVETPTTTNPTTTTPTPTPTPTPTVAPTVTPAPVKDSITAEEAARGAIKLNAGLKVYPKKSDVVVKWGKVENADRYAIYAAYCKKGRKCAKIATLDGDVNSYKFSELNGKAINTKKNIKVYVVAYRKVNGKYKKITSSITAHIVGSGSKKYSNVKGINVESTKITLSFDDNTAAPSSITLKPTAVLKDSSKKMLLHTAEFRYASSKSSVATVGKDGTITAQGKGTCYVYVYAQNGYAKKVKVTVK